jgi:hypothetical protein
MSGDPMSHKPGETVDASDWKITMTYVLLAALLLAVIFGVSTALMRCITENDGMSDERVPEVAAQTVEEHVSPDGRLRFLVVADPNGDLALGFDGYPWHTHADILASLSGLAAAGAVRQFVDDLRSDKSVIAVWGVPGNVEDVWVSEDPTRDAAYPQVGEIIELRHWSGRPWDGVKP